jgi:hypothetical protein
VTDDRHDEIARRLREEGAARAPDRLRADVMLQVRAEPRPRRIRPRRSYWRPLGSLAAAACLVTAAAFGLTRIDTGGGLSGSGAGATSAAEGRAPAGLPVLSATGGGAAHEKSAAKSVYGAATAHFSPEFQSVLRRAYEPRFALAAPLRKAFAPLEPRQGRGTHTR